MIFQDPYNSLNPRHTVGTIISAPFQVQGVEPTGGVKAEVQELMERVGLNPEHYNRYPNEFSGGQRQRIGIARAIALRPKLIVCDEPVSALDVSIQAQVINLLEDLQNEFGIAYVFVAHDLSVVRHISDRVAVMYLGHIMELTDRDELYERPLHPYTHALLSAVPVPDPDAAGKRERILLQGDLPSPINPPTGCVFHTRCWKAQEQCQVEKPVLRELRAGPPGRLPLPGRDRSSGTIIGPSDDDVAPILPDEVDRADTFGGVEGARRRDLQRRTSSPRAPTSSTASDAADAREDAALRGRPVRVGQAPSARAQEVELEQQLVLGDLLLRGHVRDAGQRQHLVRAAGGGERAGQRAGCAPRRRCRR